VRKDPAIDIEFDVPCGVATRSTTVSSDITWATFVLRISIVMGCSHVALPPLGYTTSWETKARNKLVPKILDGSESFAKLVKEAREYIRDQKAKNRGKGVVKAWSIQLHNLSAVDAKVSFYLFI
jgi:hypothetical protein